MSKTRFRVDAELAEWADKHISDMGNSYKLEGAIDLGDGDVRLWYRSMIGEQPLECKLLPKPELDSIVNNKNFKSIRK